METTGEDSRGEDKRGDEIRSEEYPSEAIWMVTETATPYRVNPHKAMEESRPRSESATLGTIEAGLPMGEFETMQELLQMGALELAEVLSITRSTYIRRRKTGRLDALESDRLLRLARLFGRAREVLQTPANAREWLKLPARFFGGRTPLDVARTEFGTREVEALLGRIEHGVFC